MFWDSKSIVEANQKFKFTATFASLPSNTGVEGSLTYSIKSIKAPSISIDFERAYANELVHYFQNGSIHWEPIEIKFADFFQGPKEAINLRRIFENYLQANKITQSNRTGIIDLPILCSSITITNHLRYYPKGIAADVVGSGYSFSIINPRLSKIDYGSFDYGSDEINEISITVIPEWCSFVEEEGVQGAPVETVDTIDSPTLNMA